jgi:hypothetical protein
MPGIKLAREINKKKDLIFNDVTVNEYLGVILVGK